MADGGKKNIVLIGMMGSGKTTCGKLLSKRLNRELVDTDTFIEAQQGCRISDIFAVQGEAFFRELERQVSLELAARRDLIIACGGGLPLRPDCIGPLRESGAVVLLNRDPETIYDQLDTAGRPLAQQGRQAFLERAQAREPVYRACADYVITNPPTAQAAVEEILNKLEALL